MITSGVNLSSASLIPGLLLLAGVAEQVLFHRPHGEGNGAPLQYSCLENPMDGGAWWAAVHGVAKSQTRLSDFPFPFPSGFDLFQK